MIRNSLFVYFFVFGLALPFQVVAKRSTPLVWDMNYLNTMKFNLMNGSEEQSILSAANEYCKNEPIVIVKDKQLSFSKDAHVYSSMGPYRWPDPNTPGKYILKDGEVNPDSKYYDSAKLRELSLRCKKLSQAYYLTNDDKYYMAFISQIRAWFIDDVTYMVPNFEFSQVIPGQNNDKGTSTGMIDAYYFNTIIESIRLVDGVKKIDRRTMKCLKKWFSAFADWSIETHGIVMSKGKQNISVAFDITMINMYIFAKQSKKARIIANSFAERRIYQQISKDGSQPGELNRTNAFSYSIANITQFLDFCYLVRYWDKNYYIKHGQLIDQAINYLVPFVENPNSFPYQQINGWKNSKNLLNQQIERRNKLLRKTK